MPYDFDSLLEQVSQPPKAPDQNKPANDFDNLVDQVTFGDSLPLESSLYHASFVNPDEEAKKQKLAREMDLRPGVLPPIPDAEAAVFRKLHPAESMLKDAPALAKWLENEDNAKVAKDDIPVLSDIGRVISNLGRSTVAGFGYTGSAGVARTVQAIGETLESATKPVGDFLGFPLTSELADLGKFFAESAERGGKAVRGEQKGVGDLERAVYSGTESLGQNLALLPLSIASGGAGPVLAGMGTVTFGQSYGQAREKGLSVSQSIPFAASQAVIEVATEKIPAGVLLRDLGLNRSFGRLLVNQLVREVPGEQLATALQDLNEWAVLHPEKTFRDYIDERPDAALQTLISTLVSTGGMTLGAKGLDKAFNGQQRAQQEALFQALGDTTQASKLRERLPEKFREVLDRYTADGPVQSVFVDSEQFTKYFQGAALDPALVAEELGVSDYLETVARGGDIAIPIAAFAEKVAPTEHLAGLMHDIKLDPAELSAREAKLAEANRSEAEKKAQGEIERIQAEAQSGASLNLQIQRIVDDVAGQLGTRYDEQTSRSMATLLRGVAVMAQRDTLGRAQAEGREATPQEVEAATQALWDKYGLTIKANPSLPAILRQKPSLEAAIDPLLDRIRTGDMPSDADLFGFSLTEFISGKGGLQDLGGELSARDADASRNLFQKKLVQKNGLTFDAARELALEAGYPVGETEASFLDALDKEIRGQAVYATGKENTEAMKLRDDLAAIAEALSQAGIDLKTADNAAAKKALFPEGMQYDQAGFVERRAQPRLRMEDLEKPLEQMTQEELIAAITRLRQHTNTNPLTGLPSKAVWEAKQAEGKTKAFVASIDADALKWFNDNIGHEPGGNVLLNRIGAALLDAGIDAYHISGDEFYAMADSQEELDSALKAAQSELAKTVIEGGGWRVTGAGFSYGIATNIPEAEHGLHQNKEDREAAGTRSARGVAPAGAVRTDGRDDGRAAENDAAAAAPDQQGTGSGQGLELFQPAFHGSPFKFDKFSLEHLGKGEGAQAYGWGLYFAGSKEVAEFYRKALARYDDLPETGPIQAAGSMIDAKIAEDRIVSTMKAVYPAMSDAEISDAIEKGRAAIAKGKGGQLYEVDIPEDGEYLLWDKPLSEQPEKVRKALGEKNGAFKARLPKEVGGWVVDLDADMKGSEVYAAIGKEFAQNLNAVDESGMAGWTTVVNTISDKVSNPEAASKFLNSLGIAGIKYLDGSSRSAGEGSYNYVIFDENAVQIARTFYQRQAEENRGKILIGDDRRVRIELLENADLSTFLHETGHFYLEVLGDLAQAAGASEQIREDYAAILKWMGVESRDKIETKHHEMFARANEAYLMEGKAPAVELRSIFARFKAWLTLIYRQLSSLNVKLSDDVRGVFNRIYATDAEIDAAQSDFLDLFASAKDMGVSQAEFNVYVSQAAQAIEAGNDKLRAKMMRVQQMKREAWWKEQLENVRQEVRSELNRRLDYRAHEILTEKDGDLKLHRGDLVRRYGAEILKRLPRGYGEGRGAVYAIEDGKGVSVDTAADLLGFESGDALIEALANLRPKNRLIVAEADARMNERHGDLLNSVEAADEAQAALHNQERERKLNMEMRALRKLQRQAESIAKVRERDQAETERLGREIANDQPPLDVFREAARRAIAEKRIRDLRPNDYLLAERKANRKAFEALGKKDYATAQQAKQQELLNFELYREATRAQAEMKKLRDYAKTFEKAAKREKLGKAGEQYLDAVDVLLQDLDLAQKSLKQIDREKIQRWLQAQENELYYTPEMAAGEFAKNWQELTVEEMRAVADALRNLDHVATKQKQIMDGQNAVDLEQAVEEAVTTAEAANKLKPQELSNAHKSWAGQKADWFVDWMGDQLNVRTMAGWLDGGKADGPWHRLLINRASQAQSDHFRLVREVLTPINQMIEEYMDDAGKHLDDEFSTRFGKMTRHQILSIAFNLGNKSNKDKLIRGGLPRWQDGTATEWTEVDVMNLVAKLDAADWSFVQRVWNVLDHQMYPAINELEKRVNGVPLKKVDAVSFEITTADGETLPMRGGYFPMAYDFRFSNAGQKQDTGPLGGLVEGGFAYVTTPKGQTKARVEGFAAPANLDFSAVLGRHLSQSILDLSHREFFLDAQKLLKQSKIRQVLQERLGEKYEKEFNNWLKRIANQGSNTPTGSLSTSARFFEQARTNTTVLFLGFKVTTVLAQFAGLANSVEKIGAGWMWRGSQEAFTHPAKALRFVMEKSNRMQQRWDTLDQSIYESMNRLHRTKYERAKDTVTRMAFAGIAMADRLVATPTWIGAYRKALAEGIGEENAIHAADEAVISSQGDGAAMELNKLQGERGFTRLFTVFYTPFAAQFNRLVTAGRKVKEGGMRYSPEFVMRALLITAIPAIIADLLTGRGPKECEIGDAECYSKWAGVKSLSSLAATMPFIREGGSAFEAWATGNYKPDLKYSPVFSALERAAEAFAKAGEAMADGEMTNDAFFKAMESSGLFLGLPTAQVSITADYLYDLLTGEADGDTWYRDLFFRRQH